MAELSEERSALVLLGKFRTKLRDYQYKAVRWMMLREMGFADGDALEDEIKASWQKVETKGGSVLYYNEVGFIFEAPISAAHMN